MVLFTPISTVVDLFFFAFLSRLSKPVRGRLKTILFPFVIITKEHRVAWAFILFGLKIPVLSRPQCFTDVSSRPLSSAIATILFDPGDTSIQRVPRALANFQSHQSSRGFESLPSIICIWEKLKAPPTRVDLSFQFVLSYTVHLTGCYTYNSPCILFRRLRKAIYRWITHRFSNLVFLFLFLLVAFFPILRLNLTNDRTVVWSKNSQTFLTFAPASAGSF